MSKYLTGVSNRSVKCWLLPGKKKMFTIITAQKGETNEAEGVSRPACLPRSPTSQNLSTRGRGGGGGEANRDVRTARTPQATAAKCKRPENRKGRTLAARPSVRPSMGSGSARGSGPAPAAAPVRRSGTPPSGGGGGKPALSSQPWAGRDLPAWGQPAGSAGSRRGQRWGRGGVAERGDTGCAGTRRRTPVRGEGTRAGCLLSPSFFAHSPAVPLSGKLRLSPPPEALAAPGRLKPPASTARAPEAGGDLHADLPLVVATARQA